MKKNKTMFIPKENLEIAEQKKYQRKVKTIPVEQQTLHNENKKNAKVMGSSCPTAIGFKGM